MSGEIVEAKATSEVDEGATVVTISDAVSVTAVKSNRTRGLHIHSVSEAAKEREFGE